MARILISYRREDSEMWASRLEDTLRRSFPGNEVFRDVTGIAPGVDFVAALDAALQDAVASIVVIGPKWLTATDKKGNRRIDQPGDFVRQEVAASLARPEVRVFPVLVQGAEMPTEEELPEPLKPLWRRNALELTVKHWDKDVEQLVRRLKEVPGLAATGQAPFPPRRILWTSIAGLAAAAVSVGLWLLPRGPGDSPQMVTTPEGKSAPGLQEIPAQTQKPAVPSTSESKKAPETTQPLDIVLRVQNTYSTTYGYSQHLIELAKIAESLSKGGIKLEVLPAGAVVPAYATLDAVAQGTIPLAWVAPGSFSAKGAAFALLDSPPFGPGPEEYLQWRDSPKVQPIVEKLYGGHGVHALPCGVIWLADMWTNAPIRTANDLKGRKIIATGALQREIFLAAGAAPVRMPGAEYLTALQAGAANSIQMLDPATGVKMGLHEFARALYYPARLAPANGIDLLVNRDTWNKIGKQNRQALEDGCKRISRQMLEAGRDAQKEAVSKAALRGVVVEELPSDVLDVLLGAWRKVALAKSDDDAFQRLNATLQ